MDVATAIHSAKQCRSIIDPIGGLPEFLDRLYRAEHRTAESSSAAAPCVEQEKEES